MTQSSLIILTPPSYKPITMLRLDRANLQNVIGKYAFCKGSIHQRRYGTPLLIQSISASRNILTGLRITVSIDDKENYFQSREINEECDRVSVRAGNIEGYVENIEEAIAVCKMTQELYLQYQKMILTFDAFSNSVWDDFFCDIELTE